MDISEKKLDSTEIFNGRVVRLTVDHAQLCDGRTAIREVVHHAGGVTVLPVDHDGFCYLVKQFRYPFEKMILEAPAGKLEKGELHLKAACRELSEETGLEGRLIYLGEALTSPGYSTEVLHIYLACDLKRGVAHPDDGEFLMVEKLKFDDVVEMVINNEITDAKTIIAVLKAEKYLAGMQ